MPRVTALATTLFALTLISCAQQPGSPPALGAQPSSSGASLAAYVMDASPSPAPPGRQPAGQQSPGCGQGQDAYRALVFLVSADTHTPVQQISDQLRTGRSLDDIAGIHASQVSAQAQALVEAWLQFALANGQITGQQAQQARAVAWLAISALMSANVSACIA
jgi:hypothetical protein